MSSPPPGIPRLGAANMGGSLLSMRQNNKGASYFRLEGLSPRLPAGMASPHKPESVPVAPPIALSFELSTELYGQLDDLKRWAWIADEAEGFVVAEIKKEVGASVDVVTLSGNQRTLDRATTEVIEFKRDAIRHIVDDLVRLEDMNIPTVMLNLKERAKKDLIYTNVGSILVSVNPYQLLPIYTPAVMEQYRRQIPGLPPHPFSVADQCYRALFEEKKNQAILVSGESGAGKTEAVKVVLQYLAEVAGSSSGVEQKILLANPILEAFGNAKTIRNNNSSRFGKWVEIHFASGRIIGAKTINYLLEKVRVVQQAATERNYHIFYQLLAHANSAGAHGAEMKTSLGLGTAQDYAILNGSGCYQIEGVDDAEEFKATMKAMKQLQFDDTQVGVVFKIVAAILHLGNIQFERETDEKCRVSASSKPALAKAAQLLAIDPKELDQALTTRSIAIMRETTVIPLNESKARESRDSLAKFLYGELFDWLVTRINEALVGKAAPGVQVQFIGVLDIFGFEIFQNNSFEQLCINFTNEKMQQMFNSSIFKEEEAVYRAEGINHDSVKFVDNQIVLDLIEKKPMGLLHMLDEEIRMPKSTDKTYLDKIAQQHKDHSNFTRPVKIANAFTVQHYAGSVTYNVEGFLDKNRDQMFDDLVRVINTTKVPIIQKIVAPKDIAPAATLGGSKKASSSASRSLATQFMAQLKELNETIAATSSHYIRCIKPNTQFQPCSQLFDTPMSLRQLRYAGVFEAVEIRKNGFPYRLSYEEFVKRFYMISQTPLGVIHGISREEARAKVETIAEAMAELRSRLHFGNTLVFYKADELKRLEDYRSTAMKAKVVMVQKLWRGARARRQYEKLAAIRDGLIAALSSRDEQTLEAALARSNELDWELREAVLARTLLTRVKAENKLLSRMKMMFSNMEALGELNEVQEQKANEFLEIANEMEPIFEHPMVAQLTATLIRSGELRAERLAREAEQKAKEEAERLARQSEAERAAEAAAAQQKAEAENRARAAEESKKAMQAEFNMGIWEEGEGNQKAVAALDTLFVQPSSPVVGRNRRGTVVEMDEEALEMAKAPLPAPIGVNVPAPTSSQEQPEEPVFSPEELMKIERVKNRLLEAISAPPYSILDGIMFEADGTVHVSIAATTTLKQAIIAAQQMGAFTHADFELRRAAYTAQLLMGIRLDCSSSNWESVKNRLDGAAASSSGFLEVPEISAARVLASKLDLADQLRAATDARDEPEMKRLIELAKPTGMDVSEEEKILAALTDLIDFLEISLAALDYVKIQTCVAAIEKMNTPTYLSSYLKRCQDALEARKPLLLDLIRKALIEMPARATMVSLKNQAAVLQIKTLETDKLEELTALSGEKLCRLQLEAAKSQGNEERAVQLSIELKGHQLERFAKKLGYEDAPSLKTPAEFASGKVFGKDKVMEGLLTHATSPIHAALTRDLDRKADDQASKLFRNVMGWMGDRHYSYPITLLQEICAKVVNVPALRDEIFAQVIKQLTSNPSADSTKRGWQLLLVLLMIVPPSPKFENYVGVWLLQHGQSYHIHELHETIFKGPLATPPTLAELIYIIYHLPPTPGESYASGKSITIEQAQKSGVDLSTPLETPALERFDKHATLRGHGEQIKKERKRISDMRPPKKR